MNIEALARGDKAALKARAAQAYGASGEAGLSIYEAYQALRAQDVGRAVQLAHAVSQQLPDNVHPWLILGMVALDRAEGATAQAFFEEALRVAPGTADALSGLGKARVLQADAFGAVDLLVQAIEAGSEDLSMIRLYKDLMTQMHRGDEAARVMEGAAARLKDASLYNTIGELHLTFEAYGKAIEAFDAAWDLAPEALDTRIGRVKALHFRQDYAAVEALTAELLAENPELDEIISLRMSALRNLRRYDEALALLDAPFKQPIFYKRALGAASHIHIDRGEFDQARLALRTALHLTDEDNGWAWKAYGTFCLGMGDYAEGAAQYAGRLPERHRAHIPYEISAPDNLTGRERLYLMGEQGVGDQLALLPLAAVAPVAEGAEVIFIGERRMGPVVAGNRLGVGFRAEPDFDPKAEQAVRGEIIFVGDLVRYLGGRKQDFGGYLRPDAERVAAFRARYREMAGGGPVVGIAWRSGDHLTGLHRSVDLADLVAQLAPGTLAVNLQYGDCREEIARAAALRPEVTIFDDPEVDQLADLGAFMAQIMAVDRVVTIDNTTAHACGALGHPNAHLLVPAGAECMWYWQRSGTRDPWYGVLNLHRQERPRDWSRPFAEIAALGHGSAG